MSESTPSLRRTGRTSRMMRIAKREAAAGKHVLILTATNDHARQLMHEHHILPDGPIRIESAQSLQIDWQRLQVYGERRDTCVHFDHYALERLFHLLLVELHRYDEDKGEEG